MLDVILDALLDTLKLLPFLYLSYLLMEFLEHKSGNTAENWLKKSGRFGPLLGATVGLLPQCGFSAGTAGLYCGRVVTFGTLLAVFLATSDEMLPLFLSEGAPVSVIVKILLFKWVCGVVVGFLADFISSLVAKKKEEPQIEALCEREHCHCSDHFAVSALRHTLRVAVFLLVIGFALNTTIYFVGEDTLSHIVGKNAFLTLLLSLSVGLIPNCASSVALTELYLSDVLPPYALLAGLLVNAGVGLLVLVRGNRPVTDTLKCIGVLLLSGLLIGLVVLFTPLNAFFAL